MIIIIGSLCLNDKRFRVLPIWVAWDKGYGANLEFDRILIYTPLYFVKPIVDCMYP